MAVCRLHPEAPEPGCDVCALSRMLAPNGATLIEARGDDASRPHVETDLTVVPRVMPTFDELLQGPSTTTGLVAHRGRRRPVDTLVKLSIVVAVAAVAQVVTGYWLAQVWMALP